MISGHVSKHATMRVMACAYWQLLPDKFAFFLFFDKGGIDYDALVVRALLEI